MLEKILNFQTLNLDTPSPRQITFQDPATGIMEGIIDLHHDLFFILIVVTFFVLTLIVQVLFYFDLERNPKWFPVNIRHDALIEIIWTILPTLILVVVAIPSFALLYAIDEIHDPLITLKVVGHQWYWHYEYSDPYLGSKPIVFESRLVSLKSLINQPNYTGWGHLRLLETDNRVFLPIKVHTRIVGTSVDVLHSWAVPSLGVKMDVCPGRLNEVAMYLKRDGVFFGQCSEICGIDHGFMPIAVMGVSLPDFLSWQYLQTAEAGSQLGEASTSEVEATTLSSKKVSRYVMSTFEETQGLSSSLFIQIHEILYKFLNFKNAYSNKDSFSYVCDFQVYKRSDSNYLFFFNLDKSYEICTQIKINLCSLFKSEISTEREKGYLSKVKLDIPPVEGDDYTEWVPPWGNGEVVKIRMGPWPPLKEYSGDEVLPEVGLDALIVEAEMRLLRGLFPREEPGLRKVMWVGYPHPKIFRPDVRPPTGRAFDSQPEIPVGSVLYRTPPDVKGDYLSVKGHILPNNFEVRWWLNQMNVWAAKHRVVPLSESERVRYGTNFWFGCKVDLYKDGRFITKDGTRVTVQNDVHIPSPKIYYEAPYTWDDVTDKTCELVPKFIRDYYGWKDYD
jgi:cytochrome c oxidase subunit 2